MNTITPEELAQYRKLIIKHAKEVKDYIIYKNHQLTQNSITELGNWVAKVSFMNFPDYEEDNPIDIAEALVVLYFDYVPDEMEFDGLYDFISSNLNYTLCLVTGAEN